MLLDESADGKGDASTGTVGDAETDAQTDDGVTAGADEATGSPRTTEAGDSERRNQYGAGEPTVRDASDSAGTSVARSKLASDAATGQAATASPKFGAYT